MSKLLSISNSQIICITKAMDGFAYTTRSLYKALVKKPLFAQTFCGGDA
ncbi:MAG: hypothetical protein VKN72_15190 [Nostocales cyanobacterium 94392]|nr:hypothetical protein [Nostocales cyanobacterium 94392]